MVYKWTNKLLIRLFPYRCLLCGDPQDSQARAIDLCHRCRDALAKNSSPCESCGLPIPVDASNRLCTHCIQRRPTYDQITAPYLYQAPLDGFVTRLKFQGRLNYGPLLADLMRAGLKPERPQPEILLPAPLHSKRLQERGFNQAAEVTRWLSKRLEIPWSADLLQRVRYTKAQSGLDRKQRHQNVRGSFLFRPDINYRHIAIIDDVVTTGATAEAMASAVKAEGIETVEIWALARTPEPGKQKI